MILPALTKILPFLTTWAAVGLATIMVLATAFTFGAKRVQGALLRESLFAPPILV